MLSAKFSESKASYCFRTILADSAVMIFMLWRITGRLQIFGAYVYNGYQPLFPTPTFNRESGYEAKQLCSIVLILSVIMQWRIQRDFHGFH